jgi:hypothetical protein
MMRKMCYIKEYGGRRDKIEISNKYTNKKILYFLPSSLIMFLLLRSPFLNIQGGSNMTGTNCV